MHSKGLKDPWGPQKNVTDSTSISDTCEVAVDFGFFRFNRKWIRNQSNYSGIRSKSLPRHIEQQDHRWKRRLQGWKKSFQRCVQFVQTANAIRLVFLVFIPLILEYLRNL